MHGQQNVNKCPYMLIQTYNISTCSWNSTPTFCISVLFCVFFVVSLFMKLCYICIYLRTWSAFTSGHTLLRLRVNKLQWTDSLQPIQHGTHTILYTVHQSSTKTCPYCILRYIVNDFAFIAVNSADGAWSASTMLWPEPKWIATGVTFDVPKEACS